ncbi:MAG TPA: ABC transporter permease subunit [Hyphomicrobiales bacterium]|nr:ABC transporter permease subunit [Hyphomicrobiales bacterium]
MGATSGFAARSVQIAFVAIVIGVWWGVTKTHAVMPLFLPPVGLVARTIDQLFSTGEAWAAVRLTLLTIVEAYALAVVAGLLAGYFVTRSRFLTEVFEPLIANLFTIPIILFFPLFVLFFGIGPGSKIAYGALYGFFPVALNTIAGFSRVERRFLWAARSMGASPFGLFRHVLVPSALPVIVTGLRISFLICLASVLGGEELSAAAGIGKNIELAAELMDPARMYSWIVFVVLTTTVLNLVLSQIEGRVRER